MEKLFWNERYAGAESVYGRQPNHFFKDEIQKLTPGKLLLPGEGEGRNALYAASLGWNVSAIDFSEVAKKKTVAMAKSMGLLIDYQLGDIGSISLARDAYDMIALIYVHLSEVEKKHLLSECTHALKVGGKILLEVFSKDQVKYVSGGPKDTRLLYSVEELTSNFMGFDFQLARTELIDLQEGVFHSGLASVVRIMATKNQKN
jgi:SAM-dependent methyltransferase